MKQGLFHTLCTCGAYAYPFHDRDAIISFDPRTYEYEKNQSLLGETARG